MFQRLRAISLTVSFLLFGFGTTYAQLSGTYTIDPSGSGTTNYTTISSAISALTTSGVNGATVFNIKQGTYTEQVSFGAYAGASAANTITFKSDVTNTAPVIITFAPTSSAITSNYTVQFNNAAYIKLDGLTVETIGTTYGRLVNMTGTSNNVVTVDNCTFNGYVGSTSSYFALWYASPTTYDSLTIENSSFNDGSYGLYIYGTSSAMSENFVFRNNTVTDFNYGYGVMVGYSNSGDISNNTIHQSSSSTSFGYGVRLYGYSQNTSPGAWTVHDNDVKLNYGYGIYAYYTYGTATEPVTIYNNAVVFNSGTTYNYGMYIYHPVHMEVTNNTIRTGSDYATNRAVYVSASTSTSYPAAGIAFKNNIFHNEVKGYPMYFYISSAMSNYITSENNLFYSPPSANSGYYCGTANYTSFAAYQTAFGDTTSAEGDAVFTNAGDWHVEGLSASNLGQSVSYVTVDLDGDTRSSTTPDIGADEFVPPLCATPSGLTFGVTTPSNTSMTWLGNSSQYDLEWGPTGFTQGTGTSTTVATNAATISTSAATIYDIYVRSNCSSAGQGYSNWSGPYTFTTPCLVQSLPVTEGFSTWIPTCWSVDEGSSPWLPYTAAAPTMAEANFWSVNDASYSLQSPIVALTANAQIKYAYSHSGQYATSYPYDSLSIRIRDVNSTTWTTLHTHKAANGNFATTGAVGVGAPSATLDQGIVMIPTSFTGDSVIVEFYAWSDWGPDLFLDNLVIEAQPACPPPTGVSVFAVTSSTAMVAFAPSTGNTSFTVEWGPCGYTPGTGASTTGTNDTILVTGLSSQTCYDFYVYGTCGTVSSPTGGGPATATTSCNAQLVPYTEGFENSPWVANTGFVYNADVFSTCWSRTPDLYTSFAWLVRTGGTPNVNTGPSSAATGSNYLYTESSWGLVGDFAEIRLPQLYKTATGAFEVSFAYHAFGAGLDSTFVDYSNDMGVTWLTMGGLTQSQTSSTDPWATFTAYPAATGDTLDIRIRQRKSGVSSFLGDMAIDDISVNVVTCPTPTVTVDSVSSTSVSISWSNALGTNPLGSNIMWGPQGFYQGTTATGININGVTSPYTITGLNPNTFYDFYVTDSCGATDFSGLAGPATAKTECVTTLSGAYTIDTAGTGANNFTTLDSAVQFLSGCGVSGPVTFTLAANQTWVTGISLTSVIGASSTNTVTFQGQTGSKVMAALGMNEAVLLNGTKYVTLKDMIIDGNGFTAIRLTNNAQYINIEDNLVVADTVGTTSSVTAITATSSMTSGTAYGNNANHITISGNEIKGGYYGIVMNGSSLTSHISDINILNNDLTLQYFYGIRCYYVEDVDIIGNSFTDSRASGSYGIYAGYCFDFNIEENNLVAKTYALYLYYANYQANGLSTQSRVVNNMAASGGAYGMYAYTPRFVDFYNNTFKGSTYGAYLYSTTSTTLKSKMWNVQNNIFVGGSNYAVYVPTIPDSIIGWDYNLYNTGGANLARWGTTNYATLAAWQTANTAYNANSDDGPVTFMSSEDLHLITGGNNIATPIASVTVDVDGDSRSTTTPDIGADEYSPITIDALNDKLLGASGGCGDSTTMIYSVFQNFGISAITTLPIEVKVTDPAGIVTTMNATYTGSLAPFAYDTLYMGSINTYSGGVYDFISYTQLVNDGRGNNDTIAKTGSSFLPYEPVVTGLVDTVCVGQDSITLMAVNVPGTTYGWYASDTSSSVLTMGDYHTVATSGQSSYWVGYLNTADSLAGPIPGGNGQTGNMFNIINTSGAPLSITGFSQGPGSGGTSVTGVTVQVYSTPGNYLTQSAASWSLAGTAVTNLTSGAATGYCPVAVTIPAGATYGFWVGLTAGTVQYTNGTGTAGVSTWFSNSDMTVTEGLGGPYPSPTFSPRNWNGTVHYGAAGCSSIRAEVEFAVNSDTALAVGSGTETVPASGTYDFDATGSYGQTYDWTYGDGNVGSGLMVQHSYPTAGVYTVSLVVMDTVCGSSDSVSFQVTSHVGLDENVLGQMIQAYPNPSNGQLIITIEGLNDFEGLLQVVNGVGQVLVQETVAKQSGLVSIPMDLRDLAKGVYTIRLAGEAGENNLRVVLQ
jgi:hypothetical protein